MSSACLSPFGALRKSQLECVHIISWILLDIKIAQTLLPTETLTKTFPSLQWVCLLLESTGCPGCFIFAITSGLITLDCFSMKSLKLEEMESSVPHLTTKTQDRVAKHKQLTLLSCHSSARQTAHCARWARLGWLSTESENNPRQRWMRCLEEMLQIVQRAKNASLKRMGSAG